MILQWLHFDFDYSMERRTGTSCGTNSMAVRYGNVGDPDTRPITARMKREAGVPRVGMDISVSGSTLSPKKSVAINYRRRLTGLHVQSAELCTSFRSTAALQSSLRITWFAMWCREEFELGEGETSIYLRLLVWSVRCVARSGGRVDCLFVRVPKATGNLISTSPRPYQSLARWRISENGLGVDQATVQVLPTCHTSKTSMWTFQRLLSSMPHMITTHRIIKSP
jgi:hypothetical protein